MFVKRQIPAFMLVLETSHSEQISEHSSRESHIVLPFKELEQWGKEHLEESVKFTQQ